MSSQDPSPACLQEPVSKSEPCRCSKDAPENHLRGCQLPCLKNYSLKRFHCITRLTFVKFSEHPGLCRGLCGSIPHLNHSTPDLLSSVWSHGPVAAWCPPAYTTEVRGFDLAVPDPSFLTAHVNSFTNFLARIPASPATTRPPNPCPRWPRRSPYAPYRFLSLVGYNPATDSACALSEASQAPAPHCGPASLQLHPAVQLVSTAGCTAAPRLGLSTSAKNCFVTGRQAPVLIQTSPGLQVPADNLPPSQRLLDPESEGTIQTPWPATALSLPPSRRAALSALPSFTERSYRPHRPVKSWTAQPLCRSSARSTGAGSGPRTYWQLTKPVSK